jgi:MYXO-CTERM domain-containing protein
VGTGADYPASLEGGPTSGGAPKGNQESSAEDAGDGTDGERTSEGCQMGGASAGGSAGGWMFAFMLLLGLRRRERGHAG